VTYLQTKRRESRSFVVVGVGGVVGGGVVVVVVNGVGVVVVVGAIVDVGAVVVDVSGVSGVGFTMRLLCGWVMVTTTLLVLGVVGLQFDSSECMYVVMNHIIWCGSFRSS
jgi:hypothetical protein